MKKYFNVQTIASAAVGVAVYNLTMHYGKRLLSATLGEVRELAKPAGGKKAA